METLLNISSPLFWFSAGVLLLILEILLTGTFFPIVFGIAAIITGGFSFVFDSFLILLAIFVASSFLGILYMKPLLSKWMDKETPRLSNTDAIIGKVGFITKEILPHEKGYIKVENEEWVARCNHDITLTVGTRAIVKRIEGVTVFVEMFEPLEGGV